MIGYEAFEWSKNLWKVTATCASGVHAGAFRGCENLNEAILPCANIGNGSFENCSKLTNVRLPNATSIGRYAFEDCFALRHITLHPNFNIVEVAFFRSLLLEVLATSAGFELDTGDEFKDGTLNPTVAITRYLKWRCENDRQKDVFHTY